MPANHRIVSWREVSRVMKLGAIQRLATVALCGIFCGVAAEARAFEPVAAGAFDREIQPLLKKLCFECHTGDQAESGVAFEKYTEANARAKDRAIWQKVLRQLQGKVMPPEGETQPTDAERQQLMRWVADFALTPDCSTGERPGRVTLRRLNKVEYNLTIRDLLALSIQPANEFPSDDVGYGFDNIGDVLSLPPVLMERYFDAAEKVAKAAILTPDPSDAPVQSFKGNTVASTGEVGFEFQGAAAGEYIVRAKASGDQAGPEPVKMALRIDGKELQVFEVPVSRNNPQEYETRVKLEKGKHRFAAAFLNDYYMPNSPDPKLKGDRNLHVDRLQVVGPIGVLPDDLPESHRRVFTKPVDPQASRETQRQTVSEILRPLASRLFRRRATDDEVTRLVKLYEAARDQGDSVERAMQLTVQALLVSPSFLFRVEEDPPAGKIRDLNDFELATRLSYFLWSSLPDDELYRAAASGELHTEEQLVAAARRMLADPKSQALIENVSGQWLQLRNLENFLPDKKRFPEFDPALRKAIRLETELFFQYIVREDRSVLEFLDADYTFVNERLAKHYGLSDVKGDEFRKVSVDRQQRGGLLGQASILSVTSNPTRTSPVKRGKWILENLFAAPPPPPPPNVPELEDNKNKQLVGTLRQRMEQHRAKPSCAACHQLMDPLGFGLENYNAIGVWRTEDGKEPIDPSGELPDGKTFRGPAELKVVLMARQEEFRRCLAEKLLTYALGRGLEYYDACAVQRISRECAAHDNRFSVLITEIVRSPAFRQRESK